MPVTETANLQSKRLVLNSSNAWLELWELRLNDTDGYFVTSNYEAVTFAGVTYSPFPIGRAEIEQRKDGTITEVFVLGKYTYVKVRQDTSKRIDKNGMSEDQDYEFTPNPNGSESCFRREDDGPWAEVRYNAGTKRYNKSRGHGLRIGARDEYHDFSF